MMVFTSMAFSAVGAPFWTNWTSVTSTSATGTLGASTITLTAVSGILPAQTSLAGSSLWACATCTATYAGSALSVATGGTANADLVALQDATTYTVNITGPPITNPVYLAFMSLGQPGLNVTDTFSNISGFVLKAGGAGSFGGSSIVVTSNTVSGVEGNGWIQANAVSGPTISSFSFVTSGSEFYQGIQIGAEAAVPEPGTLGLCLGALVFIALGGKYRQKLFPNKQAQI